MKPYSAPVLTLTLMVIGTLLLAQDTSRPKAPPPTAISPPGNAAAAPPKPAEPTEPTTMPALPTRAQPKPTIQNRAPSVPTTLGSPQSPDKAWCDVFILEDSPKDVLIFDKNGDMVQDARQVYVWFQIATNAPIAKIYRWPGLYRPATVQEENWDVRKLRVVDLQQFQQLAEDGRAGNQ